MYLTEELRTDQVISKLEQVAKLEATAMGLPEKVGVIVLWGQLLDVTFDWTEDRYLKWSHHVEAMYGRSTVQLYGKVKAHTGKLSGLYLFKISNYLMEVS